VETRAAFTASPRLPMLSVVVRIERVSRRYGPLVAVDRLTLQVPDGCIFGLLGPNGAGKSTLVNCIAGIIRPSEGTISVDGEDVGTDPIAVKRSIGYVPESPSLFPTLTVREILLLVGRMHHLEEGVLEGRVVAMMERFGLLGKADDQILTCSKGMVQKVVIAASLIHNPRLLILDEALNALDAPSVAVIKRFLRGFTDAGRTVIFCSHILEVVERLCDRIAIIDAGALRAVGSVSDIIGHAGAVTLEQAFMALTGETDIAREAADILSALEAG
jgi:ABC-2 type transport system ATP-binding protein